MRISLAALLLVACASPESADPAPVPAPVVLDSLIHQPNPEDLDCGINCEPFSTEACEGGKVRTCDPSGLTYDGCGVASWEPKPSTCAKGTKCVHRCPGCNMG